MEKLIVERKLDSARRATVTAILTAMQEAEDAALTQVEDKLLKKAKMIKRIIESKESKNIEALSLGTRNTRLAQKMDRLRAIHSTLINVACMVADMKSQQWREYNKML